MTQAMRDRVMNRFRKSGLEFLVATDVAARGIDVENIEVVFNYDLPDEGEDYVHRLGRTGRQGRSGRTISFASGRAREPQQPPRDRDMPSHRRERSPEPQRHGNAGRPPV